MTTEEKAGPAKSGPKKPDWEKIAVDFRLGRKSLRELAAEHGLKSENSIRKRAKLEGWDRDLSVKVRAVTLAKLQRRAAPRARTEAEYIEALAVSAAEIVERHRRSISELRGISDKLSKQLKAEAEDSAALGACVLILEKLAGVADRLIKLERQAFNIDGENDQNNAAQVTRIERIIYDPAHTDGAGIPDAAQ